LKGESLYSFVIPSAARRVCDGKRGICFYRQLDTDNWQLFRRGEAREPAAEILSALFTRRIPQSEVVRRGEVREWLKLSRFAGVRRADAKPGDRRRNPERSEGPKNPASKMI